jgi:hypothetical protein
MLTVAIIVAALVGYASGFIGSRKYHRRQYARQIRQRILEDQKRKGHTVA